MDKLSALVSAAQYDVCGAKTILPRTDSPTRFIYHAAMPGGGTSCLFKVLLTNVCANDCAYCVNQVQRDARRTAFQPEELAKTFMDLHAKRLVQGLFLSSGIAGTPSSTMERMIKTVHILRTNSPAEIQQVPIIIGGGQLNEEIWRYVGADYWVDDAIEGVRLCQRIVQKGGKLP